METEIKKLKKYLDETKRDCLNLKGIEELTKEGEGKLSLIEGIYQHMGWAVEQL